MLNELKPGARSRTAYEYAKTELRSAILSAKLPGGTRLVQSELAAQLNISATPVREALRDLASEGLIFLDPHHGAVVRALEVSEVAEIYEIRMALEPLMIRRVISDITEDQLERAAALQQQMATMDDIGAWVELNRQFHAIFAEASGDSRLAKILDRLRDSATPYVALSLAARPEQIQESHHEHAALLDLYRKRDVRGVIKLTVQHLESTMTAILAARNDEA